MDLFFGAPKTPQASASAAKKPAQPTFNIRVEERVVGKQKTAASRTQQPFKPKQKPRREAPGGGEHRESGQKRRRAGSPDSAGCRREEDEGEPGKFKARRAPHAHTTPNTTATRVAAVARAVVSPRDREIVNRNRERVGSLPASPRPAERLLAGSSSSSNAAEDRRRHGRGSAQRLAEKQRPREKAADAAKEIERCASVPPQSIGGGGGGAGRGGSSGGGLGHPGLASPLPAAEDDSEQGAGAVVSSADAVKQSETQYEDYFEWDDADERLSTIDLQLPGSAEACETFSLLMPRSYDREATEPRDEYLPVNDLMATVRVVAMYLVDSPDFRHRVCGDKEQGVMRQLERARNRRRGAEFVRAVGLFNTMLAHERTAGHVGGGARFGSANTIPSELAIHIIEQIYNRVVAPTVGLLRQYKAFSNNVYGEILPTLVNQIIDDAQITSDSVFVDLGCGIGNVVLQVAAQTGCQASGVEIMKVPARFAQRQAREFEHRMRQYRLDHGSVQVWRGDFCESIEVQRLLPTADVLLVNNYAFDGALNQNLMQMFLDLKEGARIVSLRPFVTPDHKISARNFHSPESILTVRRFAYWSQCVSWTDSGGEYFVQTVDRSRMRKFLASRGMA
ncbi:Nucleosomal histone H3-Lys79 methylase [Coemansia sp. RSA 1939]|nr:Nucleosomal histone H3-Lys79 methylase [Coemansia sp. RSA 1939]